MGCADDLAGVLQAHFCRHAALQPRDVYKLIYQRVFGPEHLISNTRSARERLYLEILQLPDRPAAEPLLEPLSTVLCRVNLQPFRQQGGDIMALWRMFWHTARTFQPGTLADLLRTWKVFRTTPWAQHYACDVLEQFWHSMATAGFSPVHHSRVYVQAQAPHYRVVLCSLATQHFGLAP